MSVTDIIRKANAAGVSMAADGDILRLFAPKKPPDDLLAELRDHKAEILAHLAQPWRLGLFTPGPIGDLPTAMIAEIERDGVSIDHKAGRIWLSGPKARPMDTDLLRRVMDHLRSFDTRHPPSAV